MRWYRFVVLVIIAALLQAGFLARLSVKPDLLIILLVFFAVYCKTTDAIISSFVLGFAADIIGFTMGPQIISFGIFGTALAYLRRFISIGKRPYQSLAILVVGFLSHCLAHLLTFLKGQPVPQNIYTLLLGTAIFSAAVGPFLFLPFCWWMRIKTRRFGRH